MIIRMPDSANTPIPTEAVDPHRLPHQDPWTVQDALGRRVLVPRKPQAIVSLVPSQTELLFALGVGAQVVGVSDYCVHPQAQLAGLPRVGGQKDPDLERLLSLRPDLVLANKEENLRRDVQRLEEAGVPVYVTDVRTLTAALKLPQELGALCAASPVAIAELTEQLTAGVQAAQALGQARKSRPRVLMAVWREPWIVAGPDTYMHAVLQALGADNAAAELAATARYPKLSRQQLQALGVERILLPSEPYPFTAADVPSIEQELGIPARLCDGTLACWYGPRTARIAELDAALR